MHFFIFNLFFLFSLSRGCDSVMQLSPAAPMETMPICQENSIFLKMYFLRTNLVQPPCAVALQHALISMLFGSQIQSCRCLFHSLFECVTTSL